MPSRIGRLRIAYYRYVNLFKLWVVAWLERLGLKKRPPIKFKLRREKMRAYRFLVQIPTLEVDRVIALVDEYDLKYCEHVPEEYKDESVFFIDSQVELFKSLFIWIPKEDTHVVRDVMGRINAKYLVEQVGEDDVWK